MLSHVQADEEVKRRLGADCSAVLLARFGKDRSGRARDSGPEVKKRCRIRNHRGFGKDLAAGDTWEEALEKLNGRPK